MSPSPGIRVSAACGNLFIHASASGVVESFLPRCTECKRSQPRAKCLSLRLSNAWIVTKIKKLVPAGGAHDVSPDPLVGWGGDTPSSILIALVAFGASILVPQALSFFVSQC